jgi:hypothetical protein
MELYREIRGFYSKIPKNCRMPNRLIADQIFELSEEVPIITIDINKERELMIHSNLEFSLENWNEAIKYLRNIIETLDLKYGYLLIRKVIGTKNSIRTEVESYKVTKRGVYNAEFPESPDFIEDLVRYCGRVKYLKQLEGFGGSEVKEDIDEDENEV